VRRNRQATINELHDKHTSIHQENHAKRGQLTLAQFVDGAGLIVAAIVHRLDHGQQSIKKPAVRRHMPGSSHASQAFL
jgi:hypothetical protein